MTTVPTLTPDPVVLAEVRLALWGILPAQRSIIVDDDIATAAEAADGLTITDAEGAPVAHFSVQRTDGAIVHGTLSPDGDGADGGPFADLRRPPAEARLNGAVAIIGHDPVDQHALDAAVAVPDRDVVLCVLDGPRAIPGPAAVDVTRASLQLQSELRQAGLQVSVIVVPAPQYGDERDDELADKIADAYGVQRVVPDRRPDRSLVLEAVDEDRGLPDDDWPSASQNAWWIWRPPRDRRGIVLFFTGLSGSGKSTVARAVVDRLLEDGRRKVTLLDGDLVRRNLSAGLGFSRADRDRNIERIGYVAAEIARHGGIAVCAPIAPFAATRRRVRTMAEEYGDFVLVHVATPLEECERRDRKGLYARARAGEIPDFTGISSPYEEPDDASVVIDTSEMSIEQARDVVLDHLVSGGWVPE